MNRAFAPDDIDFYRGDSFLPGSYDVDARIRDIMEQMTTAFSTPFESWRRSSQ